MAVLYAAACDDASETGDVTAEVVDVRYVNAASIRGGMGSLTCDAIFEVMCVARDCDALGAVEVTCVHLTIKMCCVTSLCVART